MLTLFAASLLPHLVHAGGVFGPDAHVACPPGLVWPRERGLDRGAGKSGAFEKVKRHPRDGSLHPDVAWCSAGIPQWEVSEEEPGHAALLNDVARGAKYHRRYAVRFQVPGDQTHGLVAHRSEANQQCGIDTVLTAPAEQGRGINGVGLALTVRRGNAVEPG